MSCSWGTKAFWRDDNYHNGPLPAHKKLLTPFTHGIATTPATITLTGPSGTTS